jgi:predicted transcriptional regulator
MANIKLQNVDDIFKPFPPINSVIEDFIDEGTVNMLFGESGDGKSYSMMWAAICVAAGIPFLGKNVKQGPVLYIDEESNESIFKTRMRKVIDGMSGDQTLPFFFTSLAGFDFHKPNDRKQLEDLIAAGGYVLIIVDALMDIMPGRDENSVKDVLPVFAFARHLANKTTCAFSFLHHTNRNGGYRGSSAIKGALDNMISIKKEGNFVTFSLEKHRDSEEKELTGEMVFSDDSFEMRSGRSLKFGSAEETVLEHLAKAGNSTIAEIEKGPSNKNTITGGSIRSAINSLVTKAFVLRTDSGGTGMTAYYNLTEDGKRVGVKKQWINDPMVVAWYSC